MGALLNHGGPSPRCPDFVSPAPRGNAAWGLTPRISRVPKARRLDAMVGARPHWWLTKDGDRDCLELYERHYSARRYADGRYRVLFVGPGEKVVLRTERADAFFVWRNFTDDSGQQGINCAAFRNEGPLLSSELIRQADQIADAIWPHSRHYTYVNPRAIRSANPGFCFLAAGWRRCGRTKGGLMILERLPAVRSNTHSPPHPQRNAAIPDKPTENEGVTGQR